jgi:uncharacterized protein (TIRG00374 family)
MSDGSRLRWQVTAGRLAGALVAAALLAAVLHLAKPAQVWRLLTEIEGRPLLIALAASAGFLGLRGVRLQLLLEQRRLGWARATLVAAVAQAAALFAPARSGELVLPWLLRRATGRDFSTGVGTLLAARTLDLATLGIWCGAAMLAAWGLKEPLGLVLSMALLLPTMLLPLTLQVLDRLAVRCLGGRGRTGRRWAQRVRRVRTEISRLRARPARLLAAAVASVAMWGLQWTVVWWLLLGMGQRWSPATVTAGASVAAVANVLPFNLVGNLGTLEAGWTAAFTALGISLETAAATGLAAHLWGLIFAALYGVIGWIALAIAERRRAD